MKDELRISAILLFSEGVLLFALVMATALSGCTPQPELTPFERQAVHAARLGWVAAGFTEGTGKCNFGGTVILRPPMDEFLQRCNFNTKAAACSRLIGPSRAPYPEVKLRPGLVIDDMGEPVIHEILHRLWECSGHYPADNDHKNPSVWTAAETDLTRGKSAQTRARSLMTLDQL